MGRSSSSSCLKIIACGGSDKAEDDDIDAPEAKASSDKRGWSFRKRSARHRVLGNNVGTETPTSAGKETPQGVISDFQSPVKSTHFDEKPQLPRPVEKNSEVLSAMEHVSESKMSPVMVTLENDSSLNYTESKNCQPVIPSEDPSNPTPDESKTANLAVVLENDSKATLAEPKIADEVNSEIDGDTKSAESKIEESVIDSENGDDADVILDEAAVITIQSAIRGFLARRAVLKLKSAIKIQAVVRGHLVRKSAVGTLHCIRGIVKVQALVRARSSKFSDKKSTPNDTQFSTVKLLKNSYARQLLESTPKPKSINIRCDPMKPNSSAWTWLERWMSVSTPEVAKESEANLVPEDDTHVQETAPPVDAEDSSITRFYSVKSKFIVDEVPKALETEEDHIVQAAGVGNSQSIEEDDNPVQDSASQAEAENPSIVRFYSVNSKFITDEVADSLEDEENDIVDDASAILDSQSSDSDPLLTEDKKEDVTPLSTEVIQEDGASVEVDNALASEIPKSQEDPISYEDEPPLESEEPKLSLKRSASEELDGEGRKFVHVSSRKASNPAFIAAHSKFEELSLATNPARSVSSSNQDDGAKSSHADTASAEQETVNKTDEPSLRKLSSEPKIHITASECGTELSISSTLDSADRSDGGITEAEKENKFLEESSDPNNCESPNVEANGILGHVGTDLPVELVPQEDIHRDNHLLSNQVESEISPEGEQKHEINIASDLATSIEPVSSETLGSSPLEQKHEQNGYDAQVKSDIRKEDQPNKFSPQASPQSHVTMSESQGTPSSQVSVKDKRRNKNDKSESRAKRGSLSSGKWSPAKPSLDSGMRSSAEYLPKDYKKNGKRRNSFGSTKSDNADQEPRESSSRNPLPSYMQATESARAKAQSPRSSPDIYEKEVSLKKRHSLPGATSGRQGSPHIQRSASQAAEGAKTNGSSERKWQR